MKEETCSIENGVLVDPDTTMLTTNIISDDSDSILNIDPLIGPLIDADELIESIDDHEISSRFEKKFVSILTLNSRKQTLSLSSTSVFPQIIRRFTGILYAIIGSGLFTCTGFIIKQLNVDFFDALLVRFILQTIILTSFILYKKTNFINGSKNLILLQIIRALLACGGILLFFMSYRYIPLPDLTTFRYTQVVWTAILAMIIFRERISIVTIFAIIFTLIGVIFVAQPTFLFNRTINQESELNKSSRLIGLTLALGCALSISFSIVLNKKLILSKIPMSILLFGYSLLNLLLLIINHLYSRFILHKYANQTMFTWQFILAASVSLIQVFSSTLSQQAVKLEHPSIITVAQSSDILFAIILQNLFTKQKSNWFVIIGSFLVTTSIFLVGINKFWKDQKKLEEKNKTKTKL